MDRVKGFFGRILKVDELREANWLLHAQKIVIHPEYNRTSKEQIFAQTATLENCVKTVPSKV